MLWIQVVHGSLKPQVALQLTLNLAQPPDLLVLQYTLQVLGFEPNSESIITFGIFNVATSTTNSNGDFDTDFDVFFNDFS